MENDASPNVDMFDLEYKKDRQMYIYLTTTRIEVIGIEGECCYLLNECIYAVTGMTGPVLKDWESAKVHIC